MIHLSQPYLPDILPNHTLKSLDVRRIPFVLLVYPCLYVSPLISSVYLLFSLTIDLSPSFFFFPRCNSSYLSTFIHTSPPLTVRPCLWGETSAFLRPGEGRSLPLSESVFLSEPLSSAEDLSSSAPLDSMDRNHFWDTPEGPTPKLHGLRCAGIPNFFWTTSKPWIGVVSAEIATDLGQACPPSSSVLGETRCLSLLDLSQARHFPSLRLDQPWRLSFLAL